MHIFDQWDSSNEGYIHLHEFQAGLLSAGILVESTLILAAMRRVNLRKNHENKVAAQEFVAFFLTICGEDAIQMQSYLKKLSKVVPEGHYGVTAFLDSHSPRVAQYLKRHGDVEVRRQSVEIKNGAQAKKQQHNLDEMEELSESDWKQNFSIDVLTPQGMWQVLTFQRGPMPAMLCFLVWEFSFALFYCLYDGFRFDRAYYYAAQSGLSVGFGSLTEECYGGSTDCTGNNGTNVRDWQEYDPSKFMTIINVLLGSSIIGGALGYFVDSALQSHGEWYEEMTDAHKRGERMDELKKEDSELALGWEYLVDYYESNKVEVNLMLIVLGFIFVGMIYGTQHEGWTFITSLYYCITAMSTAGLQGPSTDPIGMWFTGTYTLLGVPLYGACLGIFANYLIDANQAKSEDDHFNKVITANECMYFSKLLAKKGDMEAEVAIDDLNEIEFIELELIRTGKVDSDFVDEARMRFREYDSENTGFVTWTEIVASNLFRQYHDCTEDEGPDLLAMEEFKNCVNDLSKAPYQLVDASNLDPRAIEQVYHKCVDSHAHTGITELQFYHFVAAVMGGMSDVSQWGLSKPPTKRNLSSIRHSDE